MVVAIIALLAAVLLPSLNRAREKTKRTTCINNIRQLIQGVALYAGDYNEAVPALALANQTEIIKWFSEPRGLGFLYYHKYITLGTSKIYFCPSAKTVPGWWYNGDPWISYKFFSEHHALSDSFVWQASSYATYLPSQVPSLKLSGMPSSQPLAMDVWIAFSQTGTGAPITMHNYEGLNAGFADGSAHWINWSAITKEMTTAVVDGMYVWGNNSDGSYQSWFYAQVKANY